MLVMSCSNSVWSAVHHPGSLWHGGGQGFKSAHLHPTQALVTGLAGRSRRAGAVLALLQQPSPCPCRGGCLRLDGQPSVGSNGIGRA
jgi:hypothetical protein